MGNCKLLASLAFTGSILQRQSVASFCQCRYFVSLLKTYSGHSVTKFKRLKAQNLGTGGALPLSTVKSWNNKPVEDDDSISTLEDELQDSVTFDMYMPVMVQETLKFLGRKPEQVFLDMTFGAGGHSKILLDSAPDCKIIALDRDPYAYKLAKQLAKKRPGQVIPLLGKFSELPALMEKNGLLPGSIDGALLDLGPSSMHLDDPARGFSFNKNGPLDMRMDGDRFEDEPNAADFVNKLNETTLVQVLERFGNVREAPQIAHAIVEARKTGGLITSTRQLATIIETASPIMKTRRKQERLLKHKMRHPSVKQNVDTDADGPLRKADRKSIYQMEEYQQLQSKKPRIHVATQTFQALRILVNNELIEINTGLKHVHRYLKTGGVCVAISFHSLEDSIVQHHFCGTDLNYSQLVVGSDSSKLIRRTVSDTGVWPWKAIGDKYRTSESETNINPRSRSAILRAARKVC